MKNALLRTKLTKTLLLTLPQGRYLVSNCMLSPTQPIFAQTIRPAGQRAEQWQEIVAASAPASPIPTTMIATTLSPTIPSFTNQPSFIGLRKKGGRPITRIINLSFLMVLICHSRLLAAEVAPFSPKLMESTFKIEGGGTLGTCFILSKPGGTNWGWNILVTANHVLEGIATDEATLNLRQTNELGIFTNYACKIQIRDKGKPRWTRHPEADVAAMILPLPQQFMNYHTWISSDFLADDTIFKNHDLRPGDELMCLGYPLGLASGAGGFPILRSGRIASYPVWPISKAKTIFLDMVTYGGNSGGPVIFDFRKRQLSGLPPSQWVDAVGIAGLVSEDVRRSEHTEGYFGSSTLNMPLGIAVIVPAEFIKQTLDLLLVPSLSGSSSTNSPASLSPSTPVK